MAYMIARPNLLKRVNLTQIRRILMARETVTRAEIVAETGISTTTVRSLLSELVKTGEVKAVGYDASSGGRKAGRYALCPDRYVGAAFCCGGGEVQALLVDMRGDVIETTTLSAEETSYEEAIRPFLDQLAEKWALRAIGLGVPGAVSGGGYWQKSVGGEEFCQVELGDRLSARYGVSVVLENDVNATTIGFGQCYGKMFPRDDPKRTNMAYLYFAPTRVSAGFLSEGAIIRGHKQFAGELGLVPIENGMLLNETLVFPMEDGQFTVWVAQMLGWICGILNPQYIALSGPALRANCISDIGDRLYDLLPPHLMPELLYAPELGHDYREGMAYLTAEKMLESL